VSTDLHQFLDYVFGGDQEGYFALSLFKGGKPVQEQFIEWPGGRNRVTAKRLHDISREGDVYFTPALFSSKNRLSTSAIGSWVAWVDYDGGQGSVTTLPQDALSLPPAGLVVASGTPGRSHRYWRSDAFLGASRAEHLSRGLAINSGSDMSGFDIAQLLRVPGTFNHKTVPPNRVMVIEDSQTIIDFNELRFPIVPLPAQARSELQLGRVTPERWEDLGAYTQALFNSIPVVGERSTKLFELACRLFEEHFLMEEVRTIIDNAAKKWGKFDDRNDRDEQLDTIVLRAKDKTAPSIEVLVHDKEDEVDWSQPVSFGTLLHRAPTIEWIIPGILRKKGLLYLVGPTGIGKSTLALNLSLTLALRRQNFLGMNVEEGEPEKVLFASLEMDRSELLEFLSPMSEGMEETDLKLLDENMYLYARGQSLALEEERNQKAFEDQIKLGGYTGLVLDTLGASTKTSLQDETGTRKIADWLDRIRQRFGVWVIVIAHPRKAPAGVKNHVFTIDDAYGSRVFGDRANTVLMLQKARSGLQLTSVKTRFMSGLSAMYLNRGASHWYETTQATPDKPALVIKEDVSISDLIADKELRGDSDDFDLQ
jgi:energy-coupling factor transporter ATP-binding protein EcfA2